MELYNYFRSSTSYRARIALNLKGLPYEYKPIHLLKEQQLSEDFKRINPLGEVPALIHDGKVISQSIAILEYLDEVFPEPRLYPGSAEHRAHIRQFCENINSFLHPLANLKVMKLLETKYGFDEDKKTAWYHHWYSLGLSTLEKMAGANGGPWCFGKEITAADVCLIPLLFSARRFNVPLASFPTLIKIDAQAQSHEAFRKAHPLRQPDTPEELRI